MRRILRGGWLAMALLAASAGCDQSKAELEQTKTQLQAITAERDALKTQVASLQTQVSTLQQQLQQASAQQTPSQPPAAAPSTNPVDRALHHDRSGPFGQQELRAAADFAFDRVHRRIDRTVAARFGGLHRWSAGTARGDAEGP